MEKGWPAKHSDGPRQRGQASKIRIGLEAMLADRTASQIASDYQVPLAQVYTWKAAVSNHLPRILDHQGSCRLDRRHLFSYLIGTASRFSDFKWSDLRLATVRWINEQRDTDLVDDSQVPVVMVPGCTTALKEV